MFPPEIIDHILGFLQRDHATLKACARAHPSLSKLVKKHFFRNLTVQNFGPCPAGTYSPSDLLKLFVDKPSIANLVRNLQLITLGHFWDEIELLESILSTVIRLQCISLSSTTNIVWDDLSESFRAAFTNCLRLPTLTHVNLSFIDGFPLSALDHSSSLKGLSLRGDFTCLQPSSPLVFPPLDFLDICYCDSEIVASWVESRSFAVRSLKLGTGLQQSLPLFRVCANTLTTLHVDVPVYYYNTPTIPLSLSHLPHLAQLTIQTPISFGWNITSCLPATMHILNTLPSPPIKLVHLVVEIDISIDNSLNNIFDTDWSPLISFPYFDVIPKVELRVCTRRLGTLISSAELLNTLKQDQHLIQLDEHRSFRMSAVEELDDDSSFSFGSD